MRIISILKERENMDVLESERLLLRPLPINELLYIKDNKAHLLDVPVLPEALSDDVITAITKKTGKLKAVEEKLHVWYTYWLIIDKESGNGIGFVGFKGINPDGYAEVGYSISPDFRRKGLMKEALNAFIGWASKNQKLRGITAAVNKTNTGSIKVLQNCGFKLTGSSEQQAFYCLELK